MSTKMRQYAPIFTAAKQLLTTTALFNGRFRPERWWKTYGLVGW